MFVLFICIFFFFFKQKTAYEMRISDWSSDVCSSDLASVNPEPVERRKIDAKEFEYYIWAYAEEIEDDGDAIGSAEVLRLRYWILLLLFKARCTDLPKGLDCSSAPQSRSDEHTSELQSLMRISYTVFCLKKQTQYTNNIY